VEGRAQVGKQPENAARRLVAQGMFSMERRVRRKLHARCGGGESPEIISKDHLFLSEGQSRAVRLIVVGVMLVGFETVLRLAGIIQ